MNWTEGPIDGCIITPLRKYRDDRGWLAEIFRIDNLPDFLHPEMGYISLTYPGITRGPHEHVHQTDLFVFFSGTFRLYAWDARSDAPTYGHRIVEEFGMANPAAVLIPPGVVHAYRNVGTADALVVNCPNKLYGGWNKAEPVDEIRHEDTEASIFVLD